MPRFQSDGLAMDAAMHHFKELFLCIAPARFHFLKFILEGYDGLAILSSVDGKAGIVRLRYPADSEPLLFELLSALAASISKYR